MGVIKNTLVGILGLAVVGGAVAFGVPQFRKKIVDEIAKTSDIYKNSQSNNADLTKKQQDTTTELGQKINDLKETNDKLDSANASIKSKESQIADLQTKNTTLTSELNTKQTELTALQSKYDIDIDKLNADISKLIGEKTTLQSQYDEEVAKYNTDTSSLKAQINSKQNEIDSKKAELLTLQTKYDTDTASLQSLITAKQNELESVNAQLTQILSEKTALENQVTQLSCDKSLLQTQITDLQAQITALSNSSGLTIIKSKVQCCFFDSSGRGYSFDSSNVNSKDFLEAFSSNFAYSVISRSSGSSALCCEPSCFYGSYIKSSTSDISYIEIRNFSLVGFSYDDQLGSINLSRFIASYYLNEYTLNKKCFLNTDLVTDYSSLSDNIRYLSFSSFQVVDKNINVNFYVNSFDYILKYDDNNYFDFLNKKMSIDGKISSFDKFDVQFQVNQLSDITFSPYLLIYSDSFSFEMYIKTRTVIYNGKTFKLVSFLIDPVVFELKSGTYGGSCEMIFDTTAKTVTFNSTTYNYTQTDNLITVDGQFTAQLYGDNYIVFLTGLSGSERLNS